MIRRALLIGRWGVDFLFAEEGYNRDEIIASLEDIGASRSIIRRIDEIIEEASLDGGFTFTNDDLLRALVVVGPTSSGEEFIDTLVHEIHHLAVAIADNLGIDLESETPAYIAGDTARDLFDAVCTLGCGRCRCHNKEA